MSHRVVATAATVAQLFDRTPLELAASEGTYTVSGFRCKACGWQHLPFVNDLPPPHECRTDKPYHGVLASLPAGSKILSYQE